MLLRLCFSSLTLSALRNVSTTIISFWGWCLQSWLTLGSQDFGLAPPQRTYPLGSPTIISNSVCTRHSHLQSFSFTIHRIAISLAIISFILLFQDLYPISLQVSYFFSKMFLESFYILLILTSSIPAQTLATSHQHPAITYVRCPVRQMLPVAY